jgi:uracil-DNA glycosylase
MTKHLFNLKLIDSSWRDCIVQGLEKMDPAYLEILYNNPHWLPGPEKIFNAFSLPMSQVNYILFGESPYPRADSANGFAFWDAAVGDLWSETGLNKRVNRATSLRNLIKMLLVAEGLLLSQDTSQPAILNLNKSALIQTNTQLFNNLLQRGFLLLNATPVLRDTPVRKDALAWHPFIQHILEFLLHEKPQVQLILLGNIANTIDKLVSHPLIKRVYAEHPYNISFINNPKVLAFFKPLHLLSP